MGWGHGDGGGGGGSGMQAGNSVQIREDAA